ncbi:MAG: hypothetical protein WD250_05655 [Egibacteraceae bacterium]
MVAKLTFDTLLYWSVMCQYFLHDKWDDLEWLPANIPEVDVAALMARVQRFFREWHELEPRRWRDALVPVADFLPLHDRQVDMATPLDDDDALAGRLAEGFDVVLCLVVALFHKALELLPDQHIDPDTRIQPLAVGLDPGAWEADGLFDDGGISLAEALERLPGIEAIWLDRYAKPVEDEG